MCAGSVYGGLADHEPDPIPFPSTANAHIVVFRVPMYKA